MLPYLFVLVPLVLYLPAFFYETMVAFRRLKVQRAGSGYLHASWELTHTFLIVSVNYFIWLFADIIPKVGRQIYPWLMIAGAAFIVRAALYLYLFYFRASQKIDIVDQIFAWLHVAIIAGLLLIVEGVVIVLANNPYRVNTQFIPWMWPGLVLVLALCVGPVVKVYRAREK